MNIVWIFIDSVRRYYSSDDRSRLEIMDKFKQKSIEFTEVVTSAPSTVMSISAMMTGQHSFILGANYNDFRFDRKLYPSLTSILNQEGWQCYAALMHPDIREKLTCLNIYPRHKWPRKFSHGNWWTNNDILKFIKYALRNESNGLKPENKFWFIDYNCREDPKISNKVENTINLFYENGYTHSNTIFILCSDHGYPDPSRGITPELLKRKKMTHDIFMTDDNIMIPFFMSLPGIKNRQFKEQISTINIFPTLLDYLNINLPNSQLNYSDSLLPYLNQSKISYNKLARCDARFLGQSNRICCVRSKDYKLIYNYDEKKYIYYYINGLDEKQIDISKINKDLTKNFKNHKEYLINTDLMALEIFIQKYKKKIKEYLKTYGIKKIIKIIIISNSLDSFNNAIINLIENDLSKDYKLENKFIIIKNNENNCELKQRFKILYRKNYDLKIFIQTENQNIKFLKDYFKNINSRFSLNITASLTGEINQNRMLRAIKTIWLSKVFYIFEPLLILKLIIKFFKLT